MALSTAARQEHAVGDVASLVQIDRLLQGGIQPGERSVLANLLGRAIRQGCEAGAVDDVAIDDAYRLAGQDALDAREDGVRAGGELDLQQFVACRRAHTTLDQAGRQQGLWFGGEGDSARDRRGVERLDAKPVPRQRQAVGGAVVDGDRIHAAQAFGIGGALLAPEV